jgi:ketosteroid isomerase-like protein
MSDLLADRLAVGDVIIKYADSVDQLDYDRYASCFTDDVVVTGFGDKTFEGLANYMPWLRAARDAFGRTQHLIGNIQVTLDGDRAHMRSYVQATHVVPNDPDHLLTLWAAYVDDLVRTPDGWKITHHHLDRLIDARRIQIKAR